MFINILGFYRGYTSINRALLFFGCTTSFSVCGIYPVVGKFIIEQAFPSKRIIISICILIKGYLIYSIYIASGRCHNSCLIILYLIGIAILLFDSVVVIYIQMHSTKSQLKIWFHMLLFGLMLSVISLTTALYLYHIDDTSVHLVRVNSAYHLLTYNIKLTMLARTSIM